MANAGRTIKIMKLFSYLTVSTLAAASSIIVLAGCKKEETATNTAVATSPAPATASTPPAGLTPYPLTNCVVSGEKLGGDMGQPIEFAYQGQEIKFCCAMCKPKFLKDPDTYMKKIKDAEAGAKN
jgi:hypothetical protein